MRPRRITIPGLSGEPPPAWLGLLASLGAVVAGTLLVYPLKSAAPVVSLGIVYLPAILLISIIWGLRLGLLASIASAIAFNFFHIPPLHRLTVAEEANWVALAAFVIAAILSSTVAGLARAGASEAVEAEALRRSDELKTALLRTISHDLRTPLTSMIAGGSALGSPSLTEEERAELSQAIVAEGERLSRLVENLLDMSRLEAGKAEPHPEPVDLAEVLETAREGAIGAERISLMIDPDLPMVDADAAQLERAFANLLENAVRYGDGRPVSAVSRQVEGNVVVRIVDQGPGIPESDWQRIFEPFQRGAPESARTGSGLGLAIAKGFVEANRGSIGIESRPGQGTSFVVSLPPARRSAG